MEIYAVSKLGHTIRKGYYKETGSHFKVLSTQGDYSFNINLF